MNIKLRHLLFLLFCTQISHSFSEKISIDTSFSSVDLYNSLLNHSAKNSDVVLDIELFNNTDNEKQLYLSIINPTLDNIVIRNDTGVIILGDHIRFTQREFKHKNHVYPIFIKEYERKIITLKVLKEWQSVNFRVNLSSENTFIKTTNHDYFFLGIFYGVLFVYLLLLICFYIFSKNNFFLIYMTINCFMLLLFFQYSGTGYQFMWFYSATIQKYIILFAVIGYFTSHIYFIRTFFTLHFKSNFTGFILKVFIVILLLFGIITLLQLYKQSYGYRYPNIYFLLINIMLIIYAVMVTTLCYYTYKESKQREIIWVFTGMLLHFLNWIIFLNNEFALIKPLNFMDNLKLFESNNFIPHINFVITFFEVFIITIFISINYHKLIKINNISIKRLAFFQKLNINTFVLGQEAEREKISNQIGITITNDIQNLKKYLEYFQKTDEKNKITSIINDVDKTLEDISNITNNYVAPNMEQMILSELISTSTEKIFYETNLQYDFSRMPTNFKLNAVANINLYRILQEISNNILKHSSAENVAISVIKDSKSLQIKIQDDGIGFADFTPKNKGIGLMNIESRMNSLNGNFYVLSNTKKGCTIHLIMQLKEIS